MDSAGVRGKLVEALELDLVGPAPGSPLESEILPTSPSRWYLTGFLAPRETREGDELPHDETSADTMEAAGAVGSGDEAQPDRPSALRAWFPGSIGLSVLVRAETTALDATVEWGDYSARPDTDTGRTLWHRTQRRASVRLALDVLRGTQETEVPGSGGLRLVVMARVVNLPDAQAPSLPPDTRAVSVFLVNHRAPRPDEVRDEAYAFQATLRLRADAGFVARPDLRGCRSSDTDDRLADLQFRDAFEHVVGHGVSATARAEGDRCLDVATAWIPRAEVERVVAGKVAGGQLGMEALAAAASAADVAVMLRPLIDGHGEWIERQRAAMASLDASRRETATALLREAGAVRRRIAEGLDALEDPQVFQAFRLMNEAMALAARRRRAREEGRAPAELAAPAWRPFQIAFVLMNLRGLADPTHPDREQVDLLSFPTGGGKTEAYLGLAAFTLILRRLRHPGIRGAGVSVLMRYTLRLLTLDQLGRAATLACALELVREREVAALGTWPFEVGLWVGRAATPNRMGRKGETDENSARSRTIAFQNDSTKPAPLPIENCPWCGAPFSSKVSFSLQPNPDAPEDLHVRCPARSCEFGGRRRLPIVAVDEPLYRRLPGLIIATVDKFAQLPWVGESGALFGRVERHDEQGFYGPCEPGRGRLLEGGLPPPDLVIQDELHLISGPLGTMVGLYETVIDELSARTIDGREVRPKVLASTATVRRAEPQIRALFARTGVSIFPPPGLDRRDSYFARSVRVDDVPGQLHAGISAPGRSLKVVFLRTALALLSAGQAEWVRAGGKANASNPADPYMTLLGYFNSLRELGGSRRIVEDEVGSKLRAYGERRRVIDETTALASREIAYEVVELTSRESTASVASAKRRLAEPFRSQDHVDIALATNMISVGLDIVRLGLMVVVGQPKTTSEYIQATSRVGREENRPGLVVTLLNPYRPRDRSHYERFEAWHASFYRAVEAVSVTPFAPRAVDRGIAEIVVAMARQGVNSLTPAGAAHRVGAHEAELDFVSKALSRRVGNIHRDLSESALRAMRATIAQRAKGLIDDWLIIAKDHGSLQYASEIGSAPPLLRSPLDAELPRLPARARRFTAHRSLRDVEPAVNLFVRRRDGVELEGDQQ